MVKVKLIDYIPTLTNEMEPGCTPRLWNMVLCNPKLLELSPIQSSHLTSSLPNYSEHNLGVRLCP